MVASRPIPSSHDGQLAPPLTQKRQHRQQKDNGGEGAGIHPVDQAGHGDRGGAIGGESFEHALLPVLDRGRRLAVSPGEFLVQHGAKLSGNRFEPGQILATDENHRRWDVLQAEALFVGDQAGQSVIGEDVVPNDADAIAVLGLQLIEQG